MVIRVHVQPGASRDQFSGLYAGSLKIRLCARAARNMANEGLVEFLSRMTGVRKKGVIIVSGLRSRDKRVLLHGASMEDVEAMFDALDVKEGG